MAGRPQGPDRSHFALRVLPRILEIVKQLASAELRSVNAQFEVLLREALLKRGYLRDVPQPQSNNTGQLVEDAFNAGWLTHHPTEGDETYDAGKMARDYSDYRRLGSSAYLEGKRVRN